MIREVKFESQDRRMKQILAALNKHGIKDIEEANQICESYGIDPYMECESTQMICFENAKWAYVVGTAIALKEKAKDAVEAAEYIGEGLQAFCIPGSVADDRKVGIGHGRLAARLLSPETKCFAFLAGHESFAAAEGAIKIAQMANQSRPADKPLRCILNGLGKDAAMIISRINGSLTFRPSSTTSLANSRWLRKPLTAMVLAPRSTAMVPTTFAKVLPSCGRKMLTFPSRVTQPTQPASSTQLPVLTRRNAYSLANHTSA